MNHGIHQVNTACSREYTLGYGQIKTTDLYFMLFNFFRVFSVFRGKKIFDWLPGERINTVAGLVSSRSMGDQI